MSDKPSTTGHWETHSHSQQTSKVGNNPAKVSGRDAEAEGTFDHGKPVVIDSHATSFTNQGHPDKIEYKDESVPLLEWLVLKTAVITVVVDIEDDPSDPISPVMVDKDISVDILSVVTNVSDDSSWDVVDNSSS